MKKQILAIIIILLVAIIWLGPSPETPQYQTNLPYMSLGLKQLSDSIDFAEATNPRVKINNQARIIWVDSLYQQTAWTIIYLHGFTASQMEGDPIHKNIAHTFGMNLYLARLSDHGLESDSALINLTPDRLWETAKEALMIGHRLGKKVILMSTSTGGTLALKLAATYPDKVDALINYSPNVRINNPLAWIMNKPWGTNILRAISENGYNNTSGANDSIISQYWNTRYRVEALGQLEELVETTMQEDTFAKIKCPSLTLAYFKDEDNQDPTVKVSAIRWMNESLGTAAPNKVFEELSTVGVHPFASGLRSQDLPAVELKTKEFIENILGIKPVQYQGLVIVNN